MFYNTRNGLYSKQCQHSTYVGEIQLDLSLNHKITQYIDSIFYFYSLKKKNITNLKFMNFFLKKTLTKIFSRKEK